MLFNRAGRTDLAVEADESFNYPKIQVEFAKEGERPARHEISILNINTNGMGIVGQVPLQVGQQIAFVENTLAITLPARGIVMWTFADDDGFRAGIKFA